MIQHPLLIAATVWTLTFAGNTSRAEAQSDGDSEVNREYTIKAAYLYQFGRYVQWPPNAFADPQSPLVIGILGQAPFGNVLDEIARAKRIDGRPVVIRKLTSMTEYKPCHILFVAASAGPTQTAAAIELAKKHPVLLVGEEPDFAKQGGTVNFFLEENRVRFEINTEAARKEQLKISSKLLSLAKIVELY
jgi:hypothetical protein